MKSGLYVLYDEVAELYSQPLMFKNDTLAERSFEITMKNLKDDTKRPSDFRLYKIGEFDDEVPCIEAYNNIILLKHGSSYVMKDGEANE